MNEDEELAQQVGDIIGKFGKELVLRLLSGPAGDALRAEPEPPVGHPLPADVREIVCWGPAASIAHTVELVDMLLRESSRAARLSVWEEDAGWWRFWLYPVFDALGGPPPRTNAAYIMAPNEFEKRFYWCAWPPGEQRVEGKADTIEEAKTCVDKLLGEP